MSSAGAQCNHINHVNTQMPYAMTVAVVSFVNYVIAGFVKSAVIMLPLSFVLMFITLVVLKKVTATKSVPGVGGLVLGCVVDAAGPPRPPPVGGCAGWWFVSAY